MKSPTVSTMKNSNIVILMCLLFIACSCSSTKNISSSQFSNTLFSIQGVADCKESHSGDAVDSQIGEIECKEISFSYDYGKYGARGPKSAEEDFRSAFDAYHFTKFFELTHIDTKVQPIFRDSVEIIKLHQSSKVTEQTMFDCSTCNAVAEIKFKGTTFYYPTTVHQDQLDRPTEQVTMVKSGNQINKIYKTEDGKLAAVVAPAPFRRTRDFLSIVINYSSYTKGQQEEILRSIRLLKSQQ